MPPVRSQIRSGVTVDIVQKQDQPTGRLTRGVVAALLTRSASHPHGIKVRLTSGEVGRVQAVVSAQPDA
ncbi:YwbE family protein [Deinococcus soli (ex Cha et al. 2016)]|uniref:Repeat protein (TIGR03833 family) n=2 Tax=Deinococcus soli (ex Cha et al. 2016) TaxID=1309411 RepID=A0AAE3XDW8_9DEIO|nr:YwbE family protein [Deinococcus soli (ex Cha et al. 2016)]MDR6219256.1 putative repeat protein (TIGR03833 family) [Deinococcus soli (ex Cha et al. 2016)]MDR6329505.1 putative repeat protein (TIGR03833 family) [Deinococcus soli (ex Cha et al. 2016)]MDR6752165.1 putative repeat protein (TIGR03833 family) [Deinococcus soli (ex Cha et al. 2016)]